MSKPTQFELAEYARLDAWRSAWERLALKSEPGRLQSRQERIERRVMICTQKLRELMHAFDRRIMGRSTTSKPVDTGIEGWWVPASQFYGQKVLPTTGSWQKVRKHTGEVVEACILAGRAGWHTCRSMASRNG